MPGRGAPPGPNAQPRRGDWTVVPSRYDGPSPEIGPRPAGGRWLKVTREWWETLRHAPTAALFEATDWAFLRETAMLVDAFYRGETKLAGEIRLRMGKVGATPEDRARLRIRIADEAQPPAAATPQTDEVAARRARVAKLAGRSDDAPRPL